MAGRKRKAGPLASETPSSRRQSGRVTKARVTYQESNSASDNDSSDEFQEDISSASKPESSDEEEFTAAADEDSEAPEAEDGSDDEYAKKLKKEGWKKKKTKDGKYEMVMDVPTAKEAGDTPYSESTIHPNTLDFLRDLKKNNRREWLKFHDAVFR